MENLYSFFRSLVPGDVITTTGCKGVAKKNEQILTQNRLQHSGWGKYARITDTNPDLKQPGPDGASVAGVRWEGIDPSTADMFAHVACESEKTPANMRKTSKTERKVFMREYLKTRMDITDHMLAEAQDTIRRMKKQNRRLSKIAAEEKIDAGKLRTKK